MTSENDAESHEKDCSGIIAYEDTADKPYHCPLCLGSGRIPRRTNSIAERSVASIDGQRPEERRSEAGAIELLWARLNDKEEREFEQKREDEKIKSPDATNATAQSIIAESQGLGDGKERREAKVSKFALAPASEGNALKDEKIGPLKRMNRGMDAAIVKENGIYTHKQEILSDRIKQVAEDAAELQKIPDEDQGLEERVNEIMDTDGAEDLEELEIMNKFYEHQINRLQNMNGRSGERENRAVDVDAEGGQELIDIHKLGEHKTKSLVDRTNRGRKE